MNNEVEIQCGSTEISTNVKLKKAYVALFKGKTLNNEVENRGGLIEENQQNKEPKKGWIQKVLKRAESWLLSDRNKNQWLKQMRGNLSLIATVIATMTFQMALNPPGGIFSVNDDANSSGASNFQQYCKTIDGNRLCPGEAVLAAIRPDDYLQFLVSNTICFVASISVCLLLVSGIRLNHRFPILILSIGMCITLTSLAVSYITAVLMTTPDLLRYRSYQFLLLVMVNTWIGLLAIIGLWHTLRLVILGVKFFQKRRKKAKAQKTTKEIPVC